jgi:hypothetical protein
MKRPYRRGQIYEKSGAYYGRWPTADGRRRNRQLGPKRATGSSQGLKGAMAERALRQRQEAEVREGPDDVAPGQSTRPWTRSEPARNAMTAATPAG